MATYETNNANPSSPDLQTSISDIRAALWQGKWIMLVCIVASTLLGVAYLQQAQSLYAVKARLLVQPAMWPIEGDSAQQRDSDFLATHAEILHSPVVLEPVASSVTHAELPTFDGIASSTQGMMQLLEALKVEPLAGTNVLSVRFECTSPDDGIRTVNAILESYQQFLHELNDDSRLESLSLLTRSEEKLRKDLDEREQKYLELRRQDTSLDENFASSVLGKNMLESLATSLSEARQRRMELEYRFEAVADAPRSSTSMPVHASERELDRTDSAEEATADLSKAVNVRQALYYVTTPESTDGAPVQSPPPASDFLGNPEYLLVSRNLTDAEVRQRETSLRCGPGHPDFVAAQDEVAAWRERLDEFYHRAPLELQHALAEAKTRESQLADLYEDELRKSQASDDLVVRQQLELDGIERLKTIHNSIVAQLNDWHLVEPDEGSGTGVRVVVLESPTIGLGPIWPKPSLLLSLCVTSGLLVGVGLVIVTKS